MEPLAVVRIDIANEGRLVPPPKGTCTIAALKANPNERQPPENWNESKKAVLSGSSNVSSPAPVTTTW